MRITVDAVPSCLLHKLAPVGQNERLGRIPSSWLDVFDKLREDNLQIVKPTRS